VAGSREAGLDVQVRSRLHKLNNRRTFLSWGDNWSSLLQTCRQNKGGLRRSPSNWYLHLLSSV